MGIKLLLVGGLMAILLIPSGCTTDDLCLSNQHALQTGFYSAFSDKDSLLNETSVYAEGFKNFIYEKQDLTKMFLPLSFEQDTSVFVVINNTLSDTLWIKHSKELNFISRKCGFTFDFEIDTVWYTKTFVDSVALIYPSVKYGETFENVEIYLY